MPNRLIVLDQNKLREDRAPEVVYALQNEPNTHFVLPDIAFIEMTKNPDYREKTLRGSLRLLACYPNRAHVSKGLHDCYKFELSTLKSSADHLTMRYHRNNFRRLLKTLAGGSEGLSDLQRILEDPDNHYKILAGQYFDDLANKKRLGGIIEAFKKALDESTLKNLRAKRLSRSDRVEIVYQRAPRLIAGLFKSMSIPESKAWFFQKKKPMILREYYSMLLLAIDWISAGGFENAAPKTITNDMIDLEYVITATCFDGLFTGETRMIDAYNDLLNLLKRPPYPPSVPNTNYQIRTLR